MRIECQLFRGLLISALVLTTLSYGAVSAQPEKERVLLPMPSEPGRQSPMQIVTVRVGDQRVEPGRAFSGGEGWFRDLTFTLKNVSAEPISYVEVGLYFKTPEGARAEYAVHPLRYGIDPFVQDRSAVPDRAKAVMPGESVELKVAESSLASLTGLLAHAGVRAEVDQVKFDIIAIGFERDVDLMWRHGYSMRRNAADPGRFDAVGRYTLTKKEGLE